MLPVLLTYATRLIPTFSMLEYALVWGGDTTLVTQEMVSKQILSFEPKNLSKRASIESVHVANQVHYVIFMLDSPP